MMEKRATENNERKQLTENNEVLRDLQRICHAKKQRNEESLPEKLGVPVARTIAKCTIVRIGDCDTV